MSRTNPLATPATRDCEALTLRLLEMPVVAEAAARAIGKWRMIVGRDPSAQAWTLFDAAMREYVFHHVLKAANADPDHPAIVRTQMMPHEWMGMSVPGSRMAGDNPDTIYYFAPVDGTSRFEIAGRRVAPAAADLTFTVSGNSGFSRPLGLKTTEDIETAPDGSFVLTVGPEASDSPNHVRTARGAKFLFIRDTQSDWREIPHALSIRRIDPPSAPPRTIDEIALDAAGLLLDDVAETYFGMRMPLGFVPNVIGTPFTTSAMGGMATQMISYSHLCLADDEACVVTVNDPGSATRGIVMFNYWLTSIDYVDRLASLNRAQSHADPDGTVTYVVAARDPGVHNWLDTAGQHQFFLCHRWQGLREGAGDRVFARGGVVKLDALGAALPPGTRTVTPAERAAQIAERRAAYALRFAED